MKPDQGRVVLVAEAKVKGDAGVYLPLVVDVGPIGLMPSTAVRLVHRESHIGHRGDASFDLLRHIEQEGRHLIGVAVLRRAVGGDRRHRAGEGECAARVGDLIQKVTGIQELEADLQGVVAPDFREIRPHVCPALGPIPWQRILGADEEGMVRGYIDRGSAAGKHGQIRTRYADLVGQVHPVGIRNRDVAVVALASADFLDERR